MQQMFRQARVDRLTFLLQFTRRIYNRRARLQNNPLVCMAANVRKSWLLHRSTIRQGSKLSPPSKRRDFLESHSRARSHLPPFAARLVNVHSETQPGKRFAAESG